MKTLNLEVIDERQFEGFTGVLIQNTPNSEMRMVKLTDEDNKKYNRNLQHDITLLWNLYNTYPAKYRI